MFKALNPQVKDINRIIAGQKIYMPAPDIQKQSWYTSMFDSQGNLTDKVGITTFGSPNVPVGKKNNIFKKKDPSPQIKTKDALYQATAAIEGSLFNKGTYYFPLDSGKEFELDLSRYPILEKRSKERYLITYEDKIMGEDIELLKTVLQNVKIIKLSSKHSTDQIIDIMTKKQKSDSAATSINVLEHGTKIWLQAKWIETVESEKDDIPRRICIIPIKSLQERTALSISHYLLQHNIILKEVVSNTGRVISAEAPSNDASIKYSIITSIADSDKRQFVNEFAQALKWRYAPNVNISFPYADVQVNALSNMLTSAQGKELLIDFEDLYGDAILAIKKTGLKVIQIKQDDSSAVITTKLLTGMNSTYTENPIFMAAQRISPYNTKIQINGFLLDNQNSEKVLLATKSLNQKMVEFVESTGLRVIMLGHSKVFY
jgi:hypothetical protein